MHYLDALNAVVDAIKDDPEWAREHLKRVPAWAHPYWATTRDHVWWLGTTILADAALRGPGDKELARQAYADTAPRLGRSLGATGHAALYVGVPLLAAHLVARDIATATDDDGSVWSTLLGEYISALWPAVDQAARPDDIPNLALRLRRAMDELGLDGEVRGLPELVRLGTVPADAYPAAVMHLLRVIARQDWGIDARERRGRVLATMLASGGRDGHRI